MLSTELLVFEGAIYAYEAAIHPSIIQETLRAMNETYHPYTEEQLIQNLTIEAVARFLATLQDASIDGVEAMNHVALQESTRCHLACALRFRA